MDNAIKIEQFISKVKKLEKGEKLDLSSDEDLSIAVMNLISIEEHLFFSGGKTGKTSYFTLLNEVREMRKELLKMLIKEYEGEVWCISKHLLAASMRLMEVGTKALKKGEKEKAHNLFQKSYHLYNLFWGINLNIIKKENLKEVEFEKNEKPIQFKQEPFLAKVGDFIGKILDCCKE
ncbi:hypothetical protein COT62_01585 [Candidatus Roizmanbacteria bacterium CG09_land_8_20_14_0_10_41_9]|uniref:Uncharacterized protein n=1 Tax=Candidatus Roizmanbacteria bacterium CG09_land_8_20_14_0_10_41_9 TaxID=1974850 RepID=A0A2H0WT25_9BACT|nr:MAG: hypothetical protein COT62_01585 [Candidatus Roizmanbacteria bacterium CG09_land_8_20_14_0_10_41_9]